MENNNKYQQFRIIFSSKKLSFGQKLVLWGLTDCSADWFPSGSEIAQKIGSTQPYVSLILKDLKDKGIILVVGKKYLSGGGKPVSKYEINFDLIKNPDFYEKPDEVQPIPSLPIEQTEKQPLKEIKCTPEEVFGQFLMEYPAKRRFSFENHDELLVILAGSFFKSGCVLDECRFFENQIIDNFLTNPMKKSGSSIKDLKAKFQGALMNAFNGNLVSEDQEEPEASQPLTDEQNAFADTKAEEQHKINQKFLEEQLGIKGGETNGR